MHPSPEQIATNWIAYARLNPAEAPERVHERGWLIYELARRHPSLAWEAIKCVVSQYAEEELFSEEDTEAKAVVRNTAAGPLEDLLAAHGPDLIETVEREAQRDHRMSWTLGCVWQNSMTEDVWARVQRAAGGISR